MKARKVKKLDPDAPYEDALRKILAVRLDEVRSFATTDPQEMERLHAMRIAAKRVRYILEVMPGGASGLKAAKQLQDLLGEIHDCDELLPLVERHQARLRDQDAAAAAGGEPLPNRRKYRGLEALRAHTDARRGQLFGQYLEEWPRIERALAEASEVSA
jgi:CHAD domain-containing protein